GILRDLPDEDDKEISPTVGTGMEDRLPDQPLHAVRVGRLLAQDRFPEVKENPESFQDVEIDLRGEMTSHDSVGGDLGPSEDFRQVLREEVPRGALALDGFGEGTRFDRLQEALVR